MKRTGKKKVLLFLYHKEKMIRQIGILILLLLNNLSLYAGKVNISISAPKEVRVDTPFRIIYEIGSQDVNDFEFPDLNGLHLIDNYQSSSSSTTIINGKVSSKNSTTFTLILSSSKTGTYTISPARVHIAGETYTTKQIPIHVVSSSGSNSQTTPPPASVSSPSPLSPHSPSPSTTSRQNDDLLVRAIASKTTVYEQEAVLLTYKVYAAPHIFVTGFQGKLPTLNGFHIQEIEPPHGQESETYNGKSYNTAVWRQYVIYPQSSGSLTIPPLECEATINQTDGYMDPFGMFPRTSTRTKDMETNSLTIKVNPLPEAPEDFYGGVGDFNISSSINKRKLKSSDVLTLKVNITGTGNLKLIETPIVEFPSYYESYDCKVTDDYTLTRSGHEGSKIFEYRAVPQRGGKQTIPSVRFTYFDPSSGNYKTIATPSYQIDVISDPTQVSQLDVEEKEKDIKHIKLGEVELRKTTYNTFYSWKWILVYVCSIVTFLLLYVMILQQKGRLFKTPSNYRRQASKRIINQLEKSRLKKEANDEKGFYEELLNVLYSYPQNILNITKENFNKDNVRNALSTHQVPSPIIDEYLSLLEDCELTRYFTGHSDMEEHYRKAIDIINKLDNSLK